MLVTFYKDRVKELTWNDLPRSTSEAYWRIIAPTNELAARPQACPLATDNTKVPSRLGYCILYCLPCYPGLWLTIRIFPEQRPAAGRCPPISHQLTCCAVLLYAPVCSCGVQWFSLQVLWCATPVFPSQKPTMSLLKSVDSHGSRIQICINL